MSERTAKIIGRGIGVAIVATLVLTGHWIWGSLYVGLWILELGTRER